jgi:hypothetical protein
MCNTIFPPQTRRERIDFVFYFFEGGGCGGHGNGSVVLSVWMRVSFEETPVWTRADELASERTRSIE